MSVNGLILYKLFGFCLYVKLAYPTDDVVKFIIFNCFYVLVTWSYVTEHKKVTPDCKKKKRMFVTLCMAYNSETIKGIAIKHKELLHGASVCNRLKY